MDEGRCYTQGRKEPVLESPNTSEVNPELTHALHWPGREADIHVQGEAAVSLPGNPGTSPACASKPEQKGVHSRWEPPLSASPQPRNGWAAPVAKAGPGEDRCSVYLPERSTMQSDGRVR